jgi:hypothetical protein
MSVPKNRITREIAKNSLFASALKVISSAVSFNQGDLLVFDDTANLLKVPTLETEGNTFLGIAPVTVVSGKLKYPYVTDVDASAAIADVPGPVYGVVAKLILKTGDTFNPGDAVFLDPASGAQNVQAAGTKQIGVYMGGTVTATAGQQGECLLGCRHPQDTLKL